MVKSCWGFPSDERYCWLYFSQIPLNLKLDGVMNESFAQNGLVRVVVNAFRCLYSFTTRNLIMGEATFITVVRLNAVDARFCRLDLPWNLYCITWRTNLSTNKFSSLFKSSILLQISCRYPNQCTCANNSTWSVFELFFSLYTACDLSDNKNSRTEVHFYLVLWYVLFCKN